MKTIKQIIEQTPVYLNDWAKGRRFAVIAAFEGCYINEEEYNASESPHNNVEYWQKKRHQMNLALQRYSSIKILFASYGEGSYEGDAWVLFEKDGKLFEVNAGHCSCFGLEDQFYPEEVELKELENRLKNNSFGQNSYCGNEFGLELKEFLGISNTIPHRHHIDIENDLNGEVN